jgi:hypothetical protein
MSGGIAASDVVAAAMDPKQLSPPPVPTGNWLTNPRRTSWTVPGPAPDAEFHVSVASSAANMTLAISPGTRSVAPPVHAPD